MSSSEFVPTLHLSAHSLAPTKDDIKRLHFYALSPSSCRGFPIVFSANLSVDFCSLCFQTPPKIVIRTFTGMSVYPLRTAVKTFESLFYAHSQNQLENQPQHHAHVCSGHHDGEKDDKIFLTRCLWQKSTCRTTSCPTARRRRVQGGSNVVAVGHNPMGLPAISSEMQTRRIQIASSAWR